MKDLSTLRFINCDSGDRAVSRVCEAWQGMVGEHVVHYIYYSNFVLLERDPEYFRAMERADFILIDGIGMQLYLQVVKGLWPNNLNGTDLNPVFLREFEKRDIPVAFYGTTAENIEAARSNLSNDLSEDRIYYIQDGFSPLDWDRIEPGTALMIGLGSPRQENWVEQHIDRITEKRLLVITVGGFFDFASGFYVRAPKWVRTLKLEWAWRTLLHPGRHLKKRLRDLTIIFKPFWDALKHQGNKLPIRNI